MNLTLVKSTIVGRVAEIIAPDKTIKPGTLIKGRYLLEDRKLSNDHRGCSDVYEGRDMEGGTKVAIKKLGEFQRDRICEPGLDCSLEKEIEALQRFNHPAIVKLIDFEHRKYASYLVFEFLEGPNLEGAALKFSRRQMFRFFLQLCKALDYVHEKGIVHRDLSPKNVMTHGAVLKLIDFGLCGRIGFRPTSLSTIVGTARYMAPEMGRPVLSPSMDIYSLGIMFYELLTEQTPFRDESLLGLISAHAHEIPAPPSSLRRNISSAVDRIVLRMLEKKPEDRFQSALEVRDAVLSQREWFEAA
ncbi:serine/threonine protein kinase [Candidatus Micrarchaeota archaeon]|nr:serine/threonine protein kinase [Candidatus Micrarchaeota archaeon]